IASYYAATLTRIVPGPQQRVMEDAHTRDLGTVPTPPEPAAWPAGAPDRMR
ncbi:MAG: hypothetical protein QOH97_2976, partial [Actinoplanes sp.]|nr:hypothetical protein [Actinoplanes sp.]